MKKRIFSLVLALIMAVSMIPAAGAQSGDALWNAAAEAIGQAEVSGQPSVNAEVLFPELSTLDVGDNLFEENEPNDDTYLADVIRND